MHVVDIEATFIFYEEVLGKSLNCFECALKTLSFMFGTMKFKLDISKYNTMLIVKLFDFSVRGKFYDIMQGFVICFLGRPITL